MQHSAYALCTLLLYFEKYLVNGQYSVDFIQMCVSARRYRQLLPAGTGIKSHEAQLDTCTGGSFPTQ